LFDVKVSAQQTAQQIHPGNKACPFGQSAPTGGYQELHEVSEIDACVTAS
jgi:hypothetical protein